MLILLALICIGVFLVIATDNDDSHGDPCDGGL